MGLIGNFFAAVLDAIAGIGEGILSAFATVADAVIGLMLVPFASLFGAMTNAGVNGVCELMEITGRSTIGLFSLDIGSGSSIFEIVVGGIGWVTPAMRVGGMCLLFFIFLTGMVKIMLAPERPIETPGSLVAGTFAAGICVAGAPILFNVFQRVFQTFLTAILGFNKTEDLDFSGFATSAQTFVQGGDLEVSVGAQVASVVTCVVYFILIVAVAINFFKFFFEVSQRYVVLGVLFMTAPVAFAFLASAGTRRSFAAWVRMVGTTMFLVCTNAFFMGVFFKAMSSFDEVLLKLQESGATATAAPFVIVVLWCIAMSAILVVAGKLDTYLQSIGLSTAETGSSALACMAAELLDMGALEGTNRIRQYRSRTSARNTASPESGSSRAAGVPKGIGQQIQSIAMGKGNFAKRSIEKLAKYDRSGSITSASLNEIVSTAVDGVSVGGASYGMGVIKNMSGFPISLSDRLDPGTCQVSHNRIQMMSRSTSDGQRTMFTMVRKEAVTSGRVSLPGGRPVTIGGQQYIAYAYGPDALAFNTYNPGAKSTIQEKVGADVNVTQLRSNGVASGVFRAEIVGADGTKVVREWAPASCYQADAGLSASVTEIGGLTYYSYEVPYAQGDSGGDGYSGRCENPIIPGSAKDRQDWLQAQFPTISGEHYHVTGGEEGIILLEREDKHYAMAPIAEYSVAITSYTKNKHESQLDVEIITASNGTRYAAVEVPEELDGGLGELFARREVDEPFVTGIDFNAYSMPERAAESISEILKAAIARHKKGER